MSQGLSTESRLQPELLIANHGPDTDLSAFSPRNSSYHPHFADEKTEAERVKSPAQGHTAGEYKSQPTLEPIPLALCGGLTIRRFWMFSH